VLPPSGVDRASVLDFHRSATDSGTEGRLHVPQVHDDRRHTGIHHATGYSPATGFGPTHDAGFIDPGFVDAGCPHEP
jgi:hypothetical protein